MQPISVELGLQALLLSDVRARMAAAGPAAPAPTDPVQAQAASADVILTLSSAAQQLIAD